MLFLGFTLRGHSPHRFECDRKMKGQKDEVMFVTSDWFAIFLSSIFLS
jgi:hypothetical protein